MGTDQFVSHLGKTGVNLAIEVQGRGIANPETPAFQIGDTDPKALVAVGLGADEIRQPAVSRTRIRRVRRKLGKDAKNPRVQLG